MENSSLNRKKALQIGSGRVNPAFAENLQNLSFQINDQILDNQVRAVIQKLVDDFNKIAVNDLNDNLELSHFYAVDKKLLSDKGVSVCENCEIVLKYVDTSICLTDSSAVKKFQNVNEKTIHLTKDGKEVECRMSRGLVKFYLKTVDKDTAKYSKIKVVKIIAPNSQLDCKYALYQNNEEIERLNKVINAAIAHSQTTALLDSKIIQDVKATSQTSMAAAAEEVKKIFDKVKVAVNESHQKIKEVTQVGGNDSKALTETPSQEAVNAAATVAEAVAQIPSKTVILVPENEPVVLDSGASIPVDASVVVAPVAPIAPIAADAKTQPNNLLGDLAKSLFGAVKDIGSKIKLTAITDKLHVMTASSQPVESNIPKPTVAPQVIDAETLKTLKSQVTAAARDAHSQLQTQLSTAQNISSEKISEGSKRVSESSRKAKELVRDLTPERAAKELEDILTATKKQYSEKRKMMEKTASDANKKISEHGKSIKSEAAKISKELSAQGQFLMSEADTETRKLIKEGEDALAAIQIELTETEKGVHVDEMKKQLLDKVHQLSEKSDKLITKIHNDTANFVKSASKASTQVQQQAEQAAKQAEQAAKQAAQSVQTATQTAVKQAEQATRQAEQATRQAEQATRQAAQSAQTAVESVSQPLTEFSLGFSESVSKTKPPLPLNVQQGGTRKKLYY